MYISRQVNMQTWVLNMNLEKTEACSVVKNDDFTSLALRHTVLELINSQSFAFDRLSKLVSNDGIRIISNWIEDLAIFNISPHTFIVKAWEIVGFSIYTKPWAVLGLNFNYGDRSIECVLVPRLLIATGSPTVRAVDDSIWGGVVINVPLCLWRGWDNCTLRTSCH